MLIYFSTNEKYYSKFMRWLFEEPTSHVGLGFNPNGLPLVVDCTKPFGKVYHLRHWKQKYEIKYFVGIQMSPEDEQAACILAADNAVLKPYAWYAYYWGFLLGIRKRLFGIDYPETNQFKRDQDDLCTEILNPIKHLLLRYGIDLTQKDLAAMTPHMIAQEIYQQTKTNEKVVWHDFPS